MQRRERVGDEKATEPIIKLGPGRYRVPSRTDKDTAYLVKWWDAEKRWSCDCPDGINRNQEGCWHIKKVKELETGYVGIDKNSPVSEP